MSSLAYLDAAHQAKMSVLRLADLNTRSRFEALEARTSALVDADSARRRLDILSALQVQFSSLKPELAGNIHNSVSELKAYLQGLYNADLMKEPLLVEVALAHAVHYAIKMLEFTAEDSKYSTIMGSLGVLEVASSAIHMFSQRPFGPAAVVEADGIPVMVKLLSPLHAPTVISNIANAIGNMAGCHGMRLAFRSNGGIGALVRLLRPDVEASAQTAGAAALSLLAAQDIVVQDSARYLGAIDSLVTMLASGDSYAVEVARYCLQSLRHNNVKNQADIITSLRSSPALAKDVLRLAGASDLLRFQELTPQRATLGRYSEVYSTLDSLATPTRLRPVPTYPTTSSIRPSSASSFTTPTKGALPSYYLSASPPPSGVMHTPTPSHHRYIQPPASHRGSQYSSLLRSPTSSLLHPASNITRYEAPHIPALGRLGERGGITGYTYGYDESLYRLGVVPEVTGELLRRRHLARYSHEEMTLLLQEFGFDMLDLRQFRIHRISGLDLLNMTEDDMFTTLVLPRVRVGTLRSLQRAVQLFDRISTIPPQGKISEIELRLYLASSGCTSYDVDKLTTLFKSLIRTERNDFVTFFDFVRSYDWIAQAFRIYNVPA
ncbi:MAG: hypothetical protein WDW36_003707 [Sanguina aurantia]